MSKQHGLSLTPAIQWHEGMLLSPQHLQQNDLRFEQLLNHHLTLLSPYHWGINYLKFDPIIFPEGLIRILAVQAIMPDGLTVNFEATTEDDNPLEIDLKPFKPTNPKEEITVYLTMAEHLPGISPVVGEWARYISVDGVETKDINLDDNTIKIPRLIPKITLQVSDKLPSRHIGFPILKVIFQDEVFVNTNYMPACFQVNQDTSLWQQCSEAAKKIREKAVYLCDKWQNQVGTPLLQETSNLLRPLVMVLPALETLLNNSVVHPYILFQKLCEIVGVLTSLRLSQVPPVLPTYQHNDLLECFKPILELLKQSLHSIEIAFAIFSFGQKERLFYLSLNPAFLTEKLYIGLRAPKAMSELELEEWMSDCIIACDFAVESVRARRITGAARRVLRNEELYELMPSRGVVIFEVDNDPNYLQPNQNLNIFNAADTADWRPTEIVLYVRKTQKV
jgi:type VI secretion system protein ImpJ